MKRTSLISITFSLGFLGSNLLLAQDSKKNQEQICQQIELTGNSELPMANSNDSNLDLNCYLMMDPREIIVEIEALEKWFNELEENDEKVTEVKTDIEAAKIAVLVEVPEKDNALQAAKTEIEEHNNKKLGRSLFLSIGDKKTTDKEKACAKLAELEKIKEKWDECAIKWRVVAQKIQERSFQKSLQFAKLARVCELLSEEAYQAERIWNALKNKKEASYAKKKEYIELLDNTTKFAEKKSFDRSEELFQQADNAWKESKQLPYGKKIVQVADQATSVLQYVSILGIVSPAAITQMISLAASSMDQQTIVVIVASKLEEVARKYYAKMARVEAGKTASDIQNSINSCQNKLNTLQEDKKSRLQKDPEVTDRAIERAEVCIKAHKEALKIFWPEESQKQVDAESVLINTGATLGISSSSSSSSSDNTSSNLHQNISMFSTQVVNQTPKLINDFERGVTVIENKLDQGGAHIQQVGKKLAESSEEQRGFIQKVKDYQNKTEQNGAELSAILDELGW